MIFIWDFFFIKLIKFQYNSRKFIYLFFLMMQEFFLCFSMKILKACILAPMPSSKLLLLSLFFSIISFFLLVNLKLIFSLFSVLCALMSCVMMNLISFSFFPFFLVDKLSNGCFLVCVLCCVWVSFFINIFTFNVSYSMHEYNGNKYIYFGNGVVLGLFILAAYITHRA